MKSLHVLPTISPAFGGAPFGTKAVTGELVRLGHECQVLTLDSPGTEWEKNFGVPVTALGYPKHYASREDPDVYSYRYNPRLPQWLKENASGYDAIFVNGIWLYPSLGVYQALRKSSTPYFLYIHGALNPWFKRTFPLKHLKKLAYWKLLEHRTVKHARAVLFTSEDERALAECAFQPYEGHAEVVSYCASTPPANREELRQGFFQRHPELAGKRCVLFLGRVHPVKACDVLLEGFARVAKRDSNLHLIIAGPDPLRLTAKLQALAAALGIEKQVTWLGPIYDTEKWQALYAANLFIACSHGESFGVSAAEALACGIPVAISRHVGIWREVEQDRAGFIGDDTAAGVTQVLTRWLETDAGQFARMQTNATLCFQSRFEVKRITLRLLEMLETRGVSAAQSVLSS